MRPRLTETPTAALLRDAGFVEDEGVFLGDLPESLEAARLSAVTRFHGRAEEQRVGVGLERAELRDPLRGLVVLHLAVPEARGHEHRRIVLARHVVVRRV